MALVQNLLRDLPLTLPIDGLPPEIDIDFNTGDPSSNDGFLENPFQSPSFSYIECYTEYGQSIIIEKELETLKVKKYGYLMKMMKRM